MYANYLELNLTERSVFFLNVLYLNRIPDVAFKRRHSQVEVLCS